MDRKSPPPRGPKQIIVELIAGHSSLGRAVRFVEGIAVPLVIMGTNASWPVSAPGVALKHAALGFNGRTLFIGALGGTPLNLNGADIRGRGWVPVPDGAVIDFGQARLLVTCGVRAEAARIPESHPIPTPKVTMTLNPTPYPNPILDDPPTPPPNPEDTLVTGPPSAVMRMMRGEKDPRDNAPPRMRPYRPIARAQKGAQVPHASHIARLVRGRAEAVTRLGR